MGGARAPAAAALYASRFKCLKLEWTRVNLGARTLSSTSSLIIPYPSPTQQSGASAARCWCSHLDRFYLHHPVASQRRVRLNGSSRAHLFAVRDDRARAGQRLDAVPETECQAPQASSWTTAALKCPGVSGSLEGKQPVCQD